MIFRKVIFRKGVDPNYLWLIVFADMSTNLMLFFLMLFALTRLSGAEQKRALDTMGRIVGAGQSIEQRQAMKLKEERAIANLQDAVARGKLKQFAKIETTEGYVKLTLDLPVFFQSGSAELKAEPQEALVSIVEPVLQFPNDVIVEGHTDNIPISGGGKYSSNWELSVARAVSVIDFFISRGVDPRHLVAGGYGEFHPAYPNDTPDNRSRNRRIEITIVREAPLEPKPEGNKS